MARIKVERIGKLASWVRDVEYVIPKVGIIKSNQSGSFNATVGRQNAKYREKGEDKWIEHHINKDQCRVYVLLITRTEHEEMEKDITLKDKYEKEIPSKFFDKKEYWKVGTLHS